MSKIKVSFEITDNWELAVFRNFIKVLLSDDETFDVYLISNDDVSATIYSVANTLSLDSDRIVVCNFVTDKVQAINDNNIQIHLDNLQSTTLLVEETTDAYGILVTRTMNKAYLQPDYVLVFDRVLARIKDENCETD